MMEATQAEQAGVFCPFGALRDDLYCRNGAMLLTETASRASLGGFKVLGFAHPMIEHF